MQALIGLLGAIGDEASDEWTSVTIEPDASLEKVDILWETDSRRRCEQVKSSRNAVTAGDAKTWAEELKSSVSADSYQLQLVGPVTGGVASLSVYDGVEIPTPLPLNLPALIEQAAHRLDVFLAKRGFLPLSPRARELLVNGFVTRLSLFGTEGQRFTRSEFDQQLKAWVREIRPDVLPASTAPVRPQQLPAPPTDFTGRAKELADFAAKIRNHRPQIASVTGAGGIGKSSFGLRLAEWLAPDYPDGQVYIDLRGLADEPLSADAAAVRVIQAFEPQQHLPLDATDSIARYHHLLSGKKAMIFAENAATASQVEPLIPNGDSLLLFTSRSRFAVPGLTAFDLPSMDAEEAAELARKIAPRLGDDAARLVSLCGRLPLAIRISASAIAVRPDITPITYINRLADATKRAELIASTIEISLSLLSAEDRVRFRQLFPFNKTFDLQAASAAWNITIDETIDAIGVLLSHSLVEWDAIRQRYYQHDLTRLYAAQHVQTVEASQALTALSYHFLDVAQAIQQEYAISTEGAFRSLARFDLDRENITTGFLHAAHLMEREDDAARICSEYVFKTTRCREVRFSPEEQIIWLSAGMDAARKLEDFGALVMHYANLGRAFREAGRLDEALKTQETILQLSEKHDIKEDQARALLLIANIEAMRGNDDKVREALQKALPIAEAVGHPEVLVHILNSLGAHALRAKEYDESKAYLERAYPLTEKVTEPKALLSLYINFGNALLRTGDGDRAAEQLLMAEEIARRLRHAELHANVLLALGDARLVQGRPEAAIETYMDALAGFQSLGDAENEALVRRRLAALDR